MGLPDLKDLRKLAVFAECKSLTEAADKLHTSQSALSRAMQNLEQNLGVPLFTRGKNKIELNEVGVLAAEHANRIISQTESAIRDIKALHRRLHSISLISCAPAPLWMVIPTLNNAVPDKNITSELTSSNEAVIEAIQSGKCDLGIIAGACNEDNLICIPYGTESLSVLVPKEHPLYNRATVSFEDLNGFNCLLRDNIGFWMSLVRRLMPASRFLVQNDPFSFDELVHSSNLLRFYSDLTLSLTPELGGRKNIPISSKEATVHYHLLCQSKNRSLLYAFKNDHYRQMPSPNQMTPIRDKNKIRQELNKDLSIVTAGISDLNEIMVLIEHSRKLMIANGNPHQWPQGYPSKEMIVADLAQGDCKLIKYQDTAAGSFVVKVGPDPSYQEITDGHWQDNSPYIVIHRVTSNPKFRGIFKAIIAYCMKINRHIRIDTHRDNTIMQHLLKKHGFEYCGIIHIENGEERLAFELSATQTR